MTCRDFVEFLSEYLSDELVEAERAEFEAHLAQCPECVAYVDSYRMAIQLGKEAFTFSEDQVPEEVPEELVRAILAMRSRAN